MNKRYENLKYIIISIILGLELIPIYMMLQISGKDNRSFLSSPWLPLAPENWNWSNYAEALRIVGPYIANTVFISVAVVGAALFFAILAAYFFARYKVPGGGLLFAFFIFLMIMPGIANIVPLFSLLSEFNLINTLTAIIIVGTAGAQAFNIYVLKNFIEDLPYELFEAAEVDGASHFQQVVNIVFPMCGSIIGTLCILLFIREWNEYLLPLILLRDEELFPLGVGLIYLDGESVKQWGKIMAAYVVASIPLVIIFAFTMRAFIRGLSAGAVKG